MLVATNGVCIIGTRYADRKAILGKYRMRNSYTFTESIGYIMQCSNTPAMAPAVIFVATLGVDSRS